MDEPKITKANLAVTALLVVAVIVAHYYFRVM